MRGTSIEFEGMKALLKLRRVGTRWFKTDAFRHRRRSESVYFILGVASSGRYCSRAFSFQILYLICVITVCIGGNATRLQADKIKVCLCTVMPGCSSLAHFLYDRSRCRSPLV